MRDLEPCFIGRESELDGLRASLIFSHDPSRLRYITFLTDGMEATIPLALLGDDDGTVNYKVTVQRQLDEGGGFTGILDYMPDLGAAPGMVQLPGPPIL